MSRCISLALVLAALMVSNCLAQIDALQIKGPKEVAPGQLVRLDAKLEPEETPFWIVLAPTDLDYEQVADGRRLIFAVDCRPSKSITVLLLAQQVLDDRIVTRQIRSTIQIKDDQAKEPDKEEPDTPDTQPEDFKKSPLYASVFDAWETISSSSAKAKAGLVAANFDLIADRCESGKLSAIPEIWKQLSAANQTTLAENTTDWEPVGVALQQGFQNLRLSTVQEHSFHLRAVAAALRSPSNE
jgi:hypothetical protein